MSSTLRTSAGTVSLAAGTIIAQAVTGLAFLVLAQDLVPQVLGRFAAAYALTLFLGGLMDFGSSSAETRRLSQAGSTNGFRSWLTRRTLWTLSSVPLVAIAVRSVQELSVAVAIGLSMQAVAFCACSGALAGLRASKRPAWVGWLQAVGNLVFLLGCIGGNLERVAFSAAASWVVTAVIALCMLPKPQPTTQPEAGSRNPWIGAAAFGVFSIAVTAQLLMVPLLGFMAGDVAAGEYAAVYRWVAVVSLLPASFSSYIFPDLAGAPSYLSAARRLRTGFPFLAAGIATVTGVVLLAPLLVSRLLGDGYQQASSVLRWLAVAAVPSFIAQPMCALLQARSDATFVARASTAAAVVTLSVTGLLAAELGASAGAAGVGIGSGVLATLSVARHRTRIRQSDD